MVVTRAAALIAVTTILGGPVNATDATPTDSKTNIVTGLRGPRILQAAPSDVSYNPSYTGDHSQITRPPACPAGTVDFTGGAAYWWTCAIGCPGGAWADKNCCCACRVPEEGESLGCYSADDDPSTADDSAVTGAPSDTGSSNTAPTTTLSSRTSSGSGASSGGGGSSSGGTSSAGTGGAGGASYDGLTEFPVYTGATPLVEDVVPPGEDGQGDEFTTEVLLITVLSVVAFSVCACVWIGCWIRRERMRQAKVHPDDKVQVHVAPTLLQRRLSFMAQRYQPTEASVKSQEGVYGRNVQIQPAPLFRSPRQVAAQEVQSSPRSNSHSPRGTDHSQCPSSHSPSSPDHSPRSTGHRPRSIGDSPRPSDHGARPAHHSTRPSNPSPPSSEHSSRSSSGQSSRSTGRCARQVERSPRQAADLSLRAVPCVLQVAISPISGLTYAPSPHQTPSASPRRRGSPRPEAASPRQCSPRLTVPQARNRNRSPRDRVDVHPSPRESHEIRTHLELPTPTVFVGLDKS